MPVLEICSKPTPTQPTSTVIPKRNLMRSGDTNRVAVAPSWEPKDAEVSIRTTITRSTSRA